MGIGSAEEEVLLAGYPAQVFMQVKSALEQIGKVMEADQGDLFVRATTRYGLQKVRIKCRILPRGGASALKVEALADDVWGKGAREGIKKFKRALGV